ncbi:protein canopy 2 [Biomphalaria glabrata]|nr:protein canopy 2 [Biomphalaria glabrata]
MMILHLFLVFICLLQSVTVIEGQKKYCSVCRALVSEVEWLISQVDPKKSIQVGSFRVDPNGNQKIKDKQYARSELHIEEIIESVCENLQNNYAWLDFNDGTGQMVRTVGFNGEKLDDKGFNLDREKGRKLKYQCDNFLEDHEEELITLFQNEHIPNYEVFICANKLAVCSNKDVAMPLFTLPKAKDEVEIGDAASNADVKDGGATEDVESDDVNLDETNSDSYRDNDFSDEL